MTPVHSAPGMAKQTGIRFQKSLNFWDKLNGMKLFLTLLLSSFYFSVAAQNFTNDSLKQQMVRNWERAKAYTIEYLDAMPADKYGFRPVDSVRSFAGQMLHLAFANAGFVFIATGAPYPFKTQTFEKSPTAQSKDSVAYYVITSYDFVINSIRNMDVAKYGEVINWDLGGGKRSQTRLAWLMTAFEHQTHHRGQCTVYIRLVGIRPPGEKLFE
jgi:uncharacterized damage-inducible protein DinB